MRLKNILPVICCVLVFCLSCKKNNVVNPAPPIVGTWLENKQEIMTFANDSLVKDSVVNAFTAGDYIQFNHDGTGVMSVSDTANMFYNNNFTYTINNSSLVLTQTAKNSNTTSTTTYTIDQVDRASLHLRLQSTYIGTANVSYRESSEMYYTRQ